MTTVSPGGDDPFSTSDLYFSLDPERDVHMHSV